MPKGVYQHKPHTKEWKEKMSERLRGKNNPMKRTEVRGRMSKIMKGNKNGMGKRSEKFCIKLGLRSKGEKCHWWKGGISPLVKLIKISFKYRQWRSDVFTRDDFTCQKCGIKGGELHPHHIKAFSLILSENNIKTLEQALNCEELWSINNGLTLCKNCHKLTDSYAKNKEYLK